MLSEDGIYRYALWRTWDERQPKIMFIMLNPSSADAEVDDPTIRRICGFARSWRCGGVLVANLSAFRATSPQELTEAIDLGRDVVGPDTDAWLLRMKEKAAWVVGAWGAFAPSSGLMSKRMREVVQLLGEEPILCLGHTAGGHPRHPVRLPANAHLELWRNDPRLKAV